jgi:hypothetical protein
MVSLRAAVAGLRELTPFGPGLRDEMVSLRAVVAGLRELTPFGPGLRDEMASLLPACPGLGERTPAAKRSSPSNGHERQALVRLFAHRTAAVRVTP